MAIFSKPIFALIAVCGLPLVPIEVSACSCMPQGNIQERKGLADLVFYGRLTSVLVDSARESKRLRFAVQKAWRKGKRQWVKQLRVETPIESAACGFEMRPGERALIFATESLENGRRVYRTHLCSENIVAPSRRQVDSLGMKPIKRPPPGPTSD